MPPPGTWGTLSLVPRPQPFCGAQCMRRVRGKDGPGFIWHQRNSVLEPPYGKCAWAASPPNVPVFLARLCQLVGSFGLWPIMFLYQHCW